MRKDTQRRKLVQSWLQSQMAPVNKTSWKLQCWFISFHQRTKHIVRKASIWRMRKWIADAMISGYASTMGQSNACPANSITKRAPMYNLANKFQSTFTCTKSCIQNTLRSRRLAMIRSASDAGPLGRLTLIASQGALASWVDNGTINPNGFNLQKCRV